MSDSRPARGTGGFGPPTTYYGAIGLSLVGVILGILWAMNAADGPMAFHGVVFTLFSVACLWGVFDRLRRGGPRPDFATDDGYNFAIVRAGAIASTFWGVIGFVVGLVIALQLAAPALNFDWPYTNFGRLRPLHTSAVIFAFGGNVLLATSFYSVQRTCRAKLAGDLAPWFVFWGYQLFIVLVATGYVLGVTQGKEYAEPEWYIDLWLTVVWVVYLLVFLATLLRRKEHESVSQTDCRGHPQVVPALGQPLPRGIFGNFLDCDTWV